MMHSYIFTFTGAAFDPCDDENHFLLPNAGWKGTACKRTRDTSICDRYVLTGVNKWYKVLGHDDKVPRKMAEDVAGMFVNVWQMNFFPLDNID